MGTLTFKSFNQKIAFFCTTFFSFFIIFGPALTNLFLFLTLIFILLSGNLKQHCIAAWTNPVSKYSFIFFLLFLVGISWSIAETSDAFRIWKKYLPFFFILMLIPLFNSKERQRLGINIFLLSTLIVLILSYLIYFGLITEFNVSIPGRHRTLNVTMDGGFQTHIITNILIAFSSFIYLTRSSLNKGSLSLINLILFLISSYYVLFISTGTSGQVLYLMLLFVFFLQTSKKWFAIFISIAFSLTIIGVTNVDSVKKTHPNIEKSVNKIQYKYGQLFEESNPGNVNQRPQRNINSIKMIVSDPWIGTGTGSYFAAYKSKLPEIEKITTGTKWNPHNEYLSIGVQLGVLGMLFFIYLFYLQFRHSLQNKDIEIRNISQGFIAFMMIGCIANSMIMDSGEGHFYAYFSALLFSQYQQKVA